MALPVLTAGWHERDSISVFITNRPIICILLLRFYFCHWNHGCWNDRRSRRVLLYFYSAIFKLTCAKFQNFAYNWRTVWSSQQRWSPRGRPWPRGRPRGHILKSLVLASNPTSPQKCPVLDSRTALFFDCVTDAFCREVFRLPRRFETGAFTVHAVSSN